MNIIHLISNKVWGGGERYALDLCKALRADGHHVEVFTRRKEAVSRVFAGEGLLKGTLRLGGALDIITPVRLASHLNKLDGDAIVHVHNFKDTATALKAKRLYKGTGHIKVIATRHLVKAAKTNASALSDYRDLDAIVFVSQLALDEFLSTNPPIDRSKLRVIHNALPIAPRPHDIASESTAKLIFAGRIAPEKGLEVLVNALAELTQLDWRLSVCGTGAEKDVMPIISLAKRLGINNRIDWKGHVDNVLDEMAQADIAVLPSTCRESFGLTILEAFSQGLPVVTTNNGAQSEIMADGTEGLLVPPSSPTALAEALRRLIADPGLCRRLGKNAITSYTTNHPYHKFYNQMTEVYNEH